MLYMPGIIRFINKGKYDVVALCKQIQSSKTVFDVEGVHLPKHIESLDEEYVEMVDGTRMEVVIAPEDRVLEDCCWDIRRINMKLDTINQMFQVIISRDWK